MSTYGTPQVIDDGVAPDEPGALAMKPSDTVWAGPTGTVYVGRIVTVPLAGEYVPPHIWVTVTPDGKVTTTVQLLMAVAPLLRTVISPWNAPPHAFTIR